MHCRVFVDIELVSHHVLYTISEQVIKFRSKISNSLSINNVCPTREDVYLCEYNHNRRVNIYLQEYDYSKRVNIQPHKYDYSKRVNI